MNVIRFNEEKKKAALSELKKIYDCAEKVGIRDYVFVGFGLSLGIVREKDFIAGDDDMDVGIDADKISASQEIAYYRACCDAGLFGARRKISLKRNGDGFRCGLLSKRPVATGEKVRFAWFSLKEKAGGVKCCNWFFFRYGDYIWHTKGGKWVNRRKFDNSVFRYSNSDDAIMKGIPEGYISEYTEVDFKGLKVNVPVNIGSCLDFWYPGWMIPKGGASRKSIICCVSDWEDKRTWKIEKNI